MTKTTIDIHHLKALRKVLFNRDETTLKVFVNEAITEKLERDGIELKGSEP